MKRIFEYFVDHSLVVNAILVGVCLVGWLTFNSMPRDLVPNVRLQLIQLSGTLPGASAMDTEQYVTFPIEEAIHDIAGVKRLESTTSSGAFKIRVIFKPDHEEIQESLETIRARVDQLRPLLPQDLRPLTIRQEKQDTLDFMYVSLAPIDEHDEAHRKWVRSLQEQFDRVPHVVRVDSSLPRRDLYIEFDRKKIDEAGLNVTAVKQRVLEYLEYKPLGKVDVDFEEISIELRRGLAGMAALNKLPIIRNRRGEGVNLGQLAKLSLRSARQKTIQLQDGQRFVEFTLYKDVGSDILSLEKRIAAMVAGYNKRLPAPLKARVTITTGFFVERPLQIIIRNGLLGLLFVTLVLYLFLGWRVAAMAAVGLPFIYLGTFIVLDALGIGIHLISVVGMLLIVGIVVDDAILVSERYQENRGAGLDPRGAAVGAVTSLLRPVSGTVLTNIIVFMPILLIKHEMTSMLEAIPWVVIAALGLSLFESFFILPNHLKHFVSAGYQFKERRFFVWFQRGFRFVLRYTLKLRYLAVLVFVGFFALSIQLMMKMEKKFSARVSYETIYVHAKVKKTSSMKDTLKQLSPVRKVVERLTAGKVEFVTTTVGKAWTPGDYTLVGMGQAELKLIIHHKYEDAKPVAAELKKALQGELKKLAAGFAVLEVHQKDGGKKKEDNLVTIYVSGGDTLSFEEIQDKIRKAVFKVDGVERIYMDPRRFQAAWQYHPDPEKLALYSLQQRNLTRQLRQHFAPQELLRLRYRGEQITAYSHFGLQGEHSFAQLAKLTVMTPRGIPVPLSLLGQWKQLQILRKIKHQDLARKFEIDVQYKKAKIAKDAIKETLEKQLEPLQRKYPQYVISVQPPIEEEEAKQWLIKIFITCLVLIYLTLIIVLNSLFQPLLVMFAIPFGISGVIFALHLHGMPLDLMAIIGLVGLTGVVVNDSLVMVDTINKRKETKPDQVYSAVVLEGAATRLKAVVLTSLTTLGGVLPLAYGIGGKTGFAQPMVFALGWGLVFATLLTLFLLPCTLTILNDFVRLGAWVGRKARRAPPQPD